MGFHSEVPLVTLLDLVHLRITLTVLVLGGARCRNQRGIDHRAGLEQQTLRAKLVVDDLQDAWAQIMFFQQVAWTWGFAKAHKAHPVRNSVGAAQAHELPVDRHLKQSFFSTRSDSPNHCCKQWMRSIICRSNGGRPVLAKGACPAISVTSSTYGITNDISSSSTSLRVRRVLNFRPRSCCFMPLLFAKRASQTIGVCEEF